MASFRTRKRILVTGGNGFIGSKLCPFLKNRGDLVSAPEFDLLDADSRKSAVVRDAPWDVVIHLAGISHIPTCEKDSNLAYNVNLIGTAILLDEIQKNSPDCHFIFASSAQVYLAPRADETESLVFSESRPVEPQNTYAKTKYSAELLIRDAQKRWGLKSTILRLFNHTHKSQSSDFLLPHLYNAMMGFVTKGEGEISVGNLDLHRDLGGIDDLLSAFAALLDRPSPTEETETFNVCSGHPKNLRILAETLARRLNVHVQFNIDPARIRQGELKFLIGSPEKLTHATGWQPKCKSEDDLITAFLA